MTQSRTIRVLALSTGQGLTALVSLVATAVLSRVLTVQDYATYRQALLAYFFAAPLLTLGLPTALYYFLPGETQRRRGVLHDNLVLLTLMGLIFAVFLLAGGSRLLAWRFGNPELVRPLRWMAFYALFALPASAISTCLTVQNRITQLSVFNVVSRTSSLLFIIIVTLVWRTPYAALKAFMISEGAIFLVGLTLMIRAVPLDDARIDFTNMFRMVQYAVPLGLASMLGTLTLQLDKMIVAAMCNREEFAIYANGAIEIPFISVVTGSVMSVILPELALLYKTNRHGELTMLWHRAAIKCATVLMPLTVFLFTLAPEIIRGVFSAKYEDSTGVFRAYLLMMPMRITSFGAIMMSAGKSRHVLYGSAIALIANAVASVFMVRALGSMGAVYGTLIATYLTLCVYMLPVIARILGVSYSRSFPFWRIGRICVLSLPGVVPVLVLRALLPWEALALGMIAATTYAITTLLALVVAGEVRYSIAIAVSRALLRGRYSPGAITSGLEGR